jgi:hypothetical protein
MKSIILNPEAESEDTLFAAAQECPKQAIYISRNGVSLYP